MSEKLYIIGGGGTQKIYECKSTHSSVPYIRVNNEFLDLTTETTAGIQLKIKSNNQTYRPVQTYTTTSSRSSEYTETTGYEGKSSRKSTSKYSGISYYSGGLYCSTVSITKTSASTVNSKSYRRTSSYKTITSSTTGWFGPYTETLTSDKTTLEQYMAGIRYPTTSSKSSNHTSYMNFTNFSWYVIGSYTEAYAMDMDGMYANAHRMTITTPVKSTSTAIGNLSSTTTYTRSSTYTLTSSVVGNLSSTTALTKTNSRSSQYDITTE